MKNKFHALLVLLLGVSVQSQATCPKGTVTKGHGSEKEICAFTQKKYLGQEIILTSTNDYLVESGLFIGGDNKDSSNLRIEAGTRILAQPGSFIAIMRGSKIYAEGNEKNPIIFTSAKLSNRKRGEWGGLVINGNAPINACKAGANVCEAISEGIKEETVMFGGNKADDNSGVLRYLRVEFGGYPIAPDNELNGITFNGVGNGTEVDYIQVNRNADDGVEFFGGTVNVKHLVLSSNDDDGLDWDMGWTGMGQHILITQADDVADNGFEADNLKSPMSAMPRSNPTLSNVTIIGGQKSGFGMLLRRGTGAQLSNIIITGFEKGCVDIDDAETFSHAGSAQDSKVLATGLKLSSAILGCVKAFEEEAGDPWSLSNWFHAQDNNQVGDPLLNGYIPTEKSLALGNGVTPENLFFDPVDHIGAVSSVDADWTLGWTSFINE
jgi:hypothetical protein